MRDELTPKQRAFVNEYLIDLNATQAALRCGYKASSAQGTAANLMAHPYIKRAVQEAMEERAKATNITAEAVLKRYWQIATADANKLVQFRRTCCRYCYGKDHAYQWKSEKEFEAAVNAALLAVKDGETPTLPTDAGGYGYDFTLRPHPHCPECKGEGVGDVFAHDTRDVPEDAMVLYAGVKQTRDGFEIKLHDQLAALQAVARHVGLFNDKQTIEHKGDALAALLEHVAGKTVGPKE